MYSTGTARPKRGVVIPAIDAAELDGSPVDAEQPPNELDAAEPGFLVDEVRYR